MKVPALALFLLTAPLFGQQSPPASQPKIPSPGQVTGSVFCQDTGQPARFASIQLMPEHPPASPNLGAFLTAGAAGSTAKAGKPDFAGLLAASMRMMMRGSNLSTVTKLDGTFSLEKVPPGTYYVIPQLAGYVSPLSQLSAKERMKPSQDTLAAVETMAQKIIVQSEQTDNVSIELQRGATLSGIVQYDDGSPATGVMPMLLLRQKDGKWKALGNDNASRAIVTDDRGHFRFYGLSQGQYAVEAALPVVQATTGIGPGSFSMHMDMGDALEVYSGGALREKDVKPIDVGPGENVDGVNLTFPLNSLHSVSGTVVAKVDGHPVSEGIVDLLDPDSKAKIRQTAIDKDGSFHFNYVPEGDYLLEVTAAADAQISDAASSANNFLSMLNRKITKTYGTVEVPITVKADVTGQQLQVPDAGTKAN